MPREPAGPPPQHWEHDEPMEKRVNRIEDFLWGPWRNNGLNSDVRAILKSMEQRDSREKNSYRAVAIAAASAVIALLVAVINVIVIMQVG